MQNLGRNVLEGPNAVSSARAATIIDGTESPGRRRVRRSVQRYLVVADLLAFLVSLGLGYLFWVSTGSALPLGDGNSILGLVSAGYVIGLFFVYHVHGLYSPVNVLGGSGEYERVFSSATVGVVVMLALGLVVPGFAPPNNVLLILWLATVATGGLARFGVRRLVYAARRRGHFQERTLVLGANPEGEAVARQLCLANACGAAIVGFVDDSLPAGHEPIPGIPVLGRSTDFAGLVRTHQVETVVVADPTLLRENLLNDAHALETLRDVEVQMAWGAFELLSTGLRIREEGFVPLVVLNKTRITGIHWLLKTILDRVVALAVLLVFSPLILVLALVTKVTSPGPIIYRRRVVGQGRREFDAFKFRTMHVNGDAMLSPEQKKELEDYGKLKSDPRITGPGHFMRKFSIDELPQLVNVLRGEMSIVGPRMITMRELEKFGIWQHNLVMVKPGLTGLWQVSGRSDLTYEDRVRLDMHYIRNHTIWLDLDILIRTIPAVLASRGAY